MDVHGLPRHAPLLLSMEILKSLSGFASSSNHGVHTIAHVSTTVMDFFVLILNIALSHHLKQALWPHGKVIFMS